MRIAELLQCLEPCFILKLFLNLLIIILLKLRKYSNKPLEENDTQIHVDSSLIITEYLHEICLLRES